MNQLIEQAMNDILAGKEPRVFYLYGMRLRGFSIGCQPKQGLIDFMGDPSGKYYNLLVYDRQLTDKELNDYDLDYLAPIVIDIQRKEVIE